MGSAYDKQASLKELQTLLINKGLLDKNEDTVVEMLEDLAHFAYFTGCITKGDVKRFLGLTNEECTKVIKSWKLWNEGNRSCGLTRNPFTEDWTLTKSKNNKE